MHCNLHLPRIALPCIHVFTAPVCGRITLMMTLMCIDTKRRAARNLIRPSGMPALLSHAAAQGNAGGAGLSSHAKVTKFTVT